MDDVHLPISAYLQNDIRNILSSEQDSTTVLVRALWKPIRESCYFDWMDT